MSDESRNVAKKKVLALSTSYPLRESSTAGIFVHNLYRAMCDKWSIDVLCPDDCEKSGGNLHGINVTPVRYSPKRLQQLGGPGGILPSLKANPIKLLLLPLLLVSLFCYTLFKARKVSVIHANWAICGVIAGLVGKLLGKKIVLTLRGSDVEKSRASLLFKLQLQQALAGADAVVCVSKSMMDEVANTYPIHAKKLSHCNNGISEVFFNTSKKIAEVNAPLRILSVGSLIPVKGFDLLIEAIHLLPSHENILVTIIGEGPERQNLKSLIRKYNLESTIHLSGEVEYSAMPEIMANSDIFILSSRSEGRPNVVAEAVASGLPIVSAGLSGVQGLVVEGINGWLFKAGDSIALSNAIHHTILNKESLSVMGESGRQMIRKDSTWSVAADYYGSLFNKLIDENIR